MVSAWISQCAGGSQGADQRSVGSTDATINVTTTDPGVGFGPAEVDPSHAGQAGA
jgi:hypothetical protein